MTLPPLTYLTFDPLTEGVGASQVVPYARALAARDVQVTIHSFERSRPTADLRADLAASNVSWKPHDYGSGGTLGGLIRVVRAIPAVTGSELVHARSDLAAASVIAARCQTWVWDMRGFWADERIELGALSAGSMSERVVRGIENQAMRRSTAVVTLAAASLPVIERRHGADAAAKTHVIPTCVDLERFQLTAPWPAPPVQVLLSGTLSNRYDVKAMIRFSEHLSSLVPTQLKVLCPDPDRWIDDFRLAGALIGHARPSEMPEHIGKSHVGLALLRPSEVASRASMPTKLGEFLAMGRPVVVSPGLGDMEALLERFNCGVTVHDSSEECLASAALQLSTLLEDDLLPGRARALAEDHFSLSRGVEALIGLYEDVVHR